MAAEETEIPDADANLRIRRAVRENVNATIGIEIANAAETAMMTVMAVRATITKHVLNHGLIPDLLTIPDADATISNLYLYFALSFWLTEGKGNAKLFFGTTLEVLRVHLFGH